MECRAARRGFERPEGAGARYRGDRTDSAAPVPARAHRGKRTGREPGRKRIVLFVGCGHQGAAKLLERAAERRTLEAIDLLQRTKPRFVALSPHDSSEWTIGQFRRAFGNRYHGLETGRGLQL
jgi:metal-dependent hydrolase (beta-lactamase superfamily II)